MAEITSDCSTDRDGEEGAGDDEVAGVRTSGAYRVGYRAWALQALSEAVSCRGGDADAVYV